MGRAKDLAEEVNKHDNNNPDCDTKTGTDSRSRTARATGSRANTQTGA